MAIGTYTKKHNLRMSLEVQNEEEKQLRSAIESHEY